MNDDENEDAAALITGIKEWLETPQAHLDDQSRRRVLEALVVNHVVKIRHAERMRVRAKDFILIAAVLTVIGPFVPRIFKIL